MNKTHFVSFLQKTYLNKLVPSMVIETSGGISIAKFKTLNGLTGNVILNNSELDDSEIGVYYPDTLLKLLDFLDSEATVKLITKKDEELVTNMIFSDKKGKVTKYATSDPELCERVEKGKAKIDDYEVEIDLTSELLEDILKAKSCIDKNSITFAKDKKVLKVIFGSSDNNGNQIDVPLETIRNEEDITGLAFNSDVLKEVLTVNKGFDKASMEVSTKGVMKLKFNNKEVVAEYYLAKLSDTQTD